MQNDFTIPPRLIQPPQLKAYCSLPGAESRIRLSVCFDDSGPHPVDRTDTNMHAWAAAELFHYKPSHLLDVGSDTMYCAILSQFCLVTVLDIRPWRSDLDGLTVQYGDVTRLPLLDGSVQWLSCLSVCEHVGLGRYSNALDPFGTRKALRELWRVLQPGGHLLLSLPISHTAGVLYNAHRIGTRDATLAELPRHSIVAETCLYPGFGPPSRVSELGEWGYCMWCAHLRKEEG